MKKLITLCLIISVTSVYAQSEFRMPKSNDTDFTWRLADKSLITVEFNNLLKDPSELTDDVLRFVVMNVMVQSKFSLKSKNSFKPTKLNILKTDRGFSAVSHYTAENENGTEIESITYFEFLNRGDGSVRKLFTK